MKILKIIYVFCLLNIAFYFASCQKADENSSTSTTVNPKGISEALITSNSDVEGSINITSSNFEGYSLPSQVDIDAFLKNGQRAENISVNNINVPNQSNSFYTIHFDEFTNSYPETCVNLLGKDCNINLGSEALGNATVSIYSPSFVKTKAENLVNGKIIKNNGLNISWTPDTRGTQVAIILSYNGNAYPNKGTDLPQELITTYKLVDDATGSIIFSAEELSKFPIRGGIRFFVGRTTQKVISTSKGKKIAVTCLATSASDDYELE